MASAAATTTTQHTLRVRLCCAKLLLEERETRLDGADALGSCGRGGLQEEGQRVAGRL